MIIIVCILFFFGGFHFGQAYSMGKIIDWTAKNCFNKPQEVEIVNKAIMEAYKINEKTITDGW